MKSSWTNEEVEVIRCNYESKSHAEIGQMIGRTSNAVRGKCHRLGFIVIRPGLNEETKELIKERYAERIGGKLDLDSFAVTIGVHKTVICTFAKSIGLTDLNRTWYKPPVKMFATNEELREHRKRTRKQWCKDNPHPKGMLGKKHSDESKMLISGNNAKAATTHGLSKSKEYAAWHSMKKRCYGKGKNTLRYRELGITVCDRWLESWLNFLEDMGNAPSPIHSIDRIDGTGNYCPDNCRWATPLIQARNTSRNIWFKLNGKKRSLSELSDISGLPNKVLRDRIVKLKWTVEKAVYTPKQQPEPK